MHNYNTSGALQFGKMTDGTNKIIRNSKYNYK